MSNWGGDVYVSYCTTTHVTTYSIQEMQVIIEDAKEKPLEFIEAVVARNVAAEYQNKLLSTKQEQENAVGTFVGTLLSICVFASLSKRIRACF